MAASGEFRLSISKALTDQLRAHLETLSAEALTAENLGHLEARQGVYQLYVEKKLVYIGSASTSLPERLRQHLWKIAGRQNISVKDVGFSCLYVDEDLTVLAPEDRLIAAFKEEGSSPWNFNGFGNKDLGKERDSTRLRPTHFDRLYPIRLDWPCDIEAGTYGAHPLLKQLKKELPFLLRFERSKGAKAVYERTEIAVPERGMAAEDLLRLVAEGLPDFQITALSGYVIMYREQRDYPDARIIGP
jgi:hypothetical protein